MRPLHIWLLLAALVPATASADALRCGDRLVHTDASAGEVLATCGEPSYRESSQVLRGELDFIEAETWTYNFGPDRFLRTLHFRGGRLVAIESGRYGYRAEAAAPD